MYMPNCTHLIAQLLLACLKTELLLPPVSEMGKFHTLALNFGD